MQQQEPMSGTKLESLLGSNPENGWDSHPRGPPTPADRTSRNATQLTPVQKNRFSSKRLAKLFFLGGSSGYNVVHADANLWTMTYMVPVQLGLKPGDQ